MRTYETIGPCPTDEDCAQVGSEGYRERALTECIAYADAIRKVCGHEPDGTRLGVKAFPHDFGTYYEVVYSYDDEDAAHWDYFQKIECGLATWAEAGMTAP